MKHKWLTLLNVFINQEPIGWAYSHGCEEVEQCGAIVEICPKNQSSVHLYKESKK